MSSRGRICLFRFFDFDRAVQHIEDAFGRRAGYHTLVVELGQLPEGLEHLDSGHHDDQEAANLHIAVAHPLGPDAKGHGGPRGDAQNGDPAGGDVGRQHSHGAPV